MSYRETTILTAPPPPPPAPNSILVMSTAIAEDVVEEYEDQFNIVVVCETDYSHANERDCRSGGKTQR